MSLPSACADGINEILSGDILDVNAQLPLLIFFRSVGRHSNLAESLVPNTASGYSDMIPDMAGSNPISTSIWNPLQTPRTGFSDLMNSTSSLDSLLFILAAKMAPALT